MTPVITVELTGLRFFAYHGVHQEEAVLGNEFEVDVFLEHQAPSEPIINIADTINYVTVHELINEEMQERQHLLETVVMRIAERLHQQFPRVTKVSITLGKLTPPITGFVGRVGVSYVKEFGV